ncbi:hypothetical protein [Thalassolituus hydrocarboniclasticus]|uniref:GLUG domain-containing protein n=1 Tax=Thalassolituus hydrocarboniclasticus TaxID=2742796 RepID=A0ABY6A8W4_9GAMM|nr:hypothetical protein [Thalassolituus hydrocarboniclasticus]UXD86379.1 hypothetical protein HUF19_02495 [Thalassolituus hydrocarboniclasticus]
MKLTTTLLTAAIAGASSLLHAADVREDYDLNDNGLIEINSLQDLDAMRNYRDAEYEFNLSTAAGCPEGGCTGFELTTDLNFDTNSDGVINASDEFWNEGAGWEPVGGTPTFGAIFDGNNHVIRNLYINRPESDNVGLFGVVYSGTSHIRNLAIAGPLTSVTGKNDVGILIGRITRGDVTNVSTSGIVQGAINVGGLIGGAYYEGSRRKVTLCYSTADVSASESPAGGLIGFSNRTDVYQCFAKGDVTANAKAGGFIGVTQNISIGDSYATGDVSANDIAGGLIGANDFGVLNVYFTYATGKVSISNSTGIAGGLIGQANNSSINSSHWATETGQQYLNGSGTISGDDKNSSHTQAVLSCPVAADDTDCTTDTTLYPGWTNSYTMADDTEVGYWDFGTDGQMPVLTAQGYVLRDRDGDGIWDFNDTYPDDPSNTAPKSSSGSSGGGSLIWLLCLLPFTLRLNKVIRH